MRRLPCLQKGLIALAVFVVAEQKASAQFACPTAAEVQLQLALDQAAAQGGGTVQIPAGVYETCQTLLIGSNVHLRGAGRGATIIRGSGTITGKTVLGAYIGATIGGAGVGNVSVSDLTIDHRTYSRNANGISFVPTGASYTGTVPVKIVIERVEIYGAAAGYHNYLVWNLKGQHVRIRDNWLDGGYPIPIGAARPQEGIESFGGYDVLITGNTVRGVAGACINVGSAGIPQSEIEGITISQNYLFGCHVGVNLGTSSESGGQSNFDSRIVDNVILFAAAVGIDIRVASGTAERNLQIAGNTIRVAGPGGLVAGIQVAAHGTADVGPVTIARNQIDTMLGAHAQGIRLMYAANVRLLDNTIFNTHGDGVVAYGADDLEVTGNRIEQTGGYAIYVGPVAARPILTENVIAQWAAGSPAILVEGSTYGAVHRNLFRRTDGAQPTPIIVITSCGVEIGGNQALYGAAAPNWSTISCQ